MKHLDLTCLSLRQLVSLDACTRCGECLPACPVLAAAAEDHATAFRKIALWRSCWRSGGRVREAADERSSGWRGAWERLAYGDVPPAAAMTAAAYDCTLCGRCAAVCPVGIQTHELWVVERRQLVRADMAPAALSGLAARLNESGNIAERPAAERLSWLPDAEEAAEEAQPEVILFAGCVASLYPQAFAAARSLLGILRAAGMRVGLLGAAEPCCGFPLYASGLEEQAVAQARRTLALLRTRGAKCLVTPCPSCYYVFSELYGRWLGSEWDVQVVHSTEYLDGIAGRLRPLLRPLALRVTYHDPCDLGRLAGIYEAPRRLLGLIPGLELLEMAENREQALCCGGGGDVEMVRPELTQAIAGRRFEQALATGAEAIVTACPQCMRTLSAAARRARQRVRTYDVAEMLLLSMQG